MENKRKEIVLIAGGTGLVGIEMKRVFEAENFEVRILTRKVSNYEKGLYHWDPYSKQIDNKAIEDVSLLINLCGEGVTDKRWSKKRTQALFDSRIIPTQFLYENLDKMTSLKHYISASGAVCYGYDTKNAPFSIENSFGRDVLGRITKDWEAAADLFSNAVKVTKLRIGMVFAKEGGAITVMAKPIRYGFGTILGSGKQESPWVCNEKLAEIALKCYKEEITGPVHAVNGNVSNEDLTRAMAKVLNKKLWMPKAPKFALKLLLGEMSELLLESAPVVIDERFPKATLENVVKRCLEK